jgi:contact-dependent growth inhibition (CDI) system CdiI-like immunity protein
METKHTSHKVEISTENFPTLHTFLRGYFHEDMADEYGTAPEAAEQFCEDADADERNPVAREWRQLSEQTHAHPATLNAALKKLGSAVMLGEEEIPQVTAIFARCLEVRPKRRAANE